jgi:hypothetical protein
MLLSSLLLLVCCCCCCPCSYAVVVVVVVGTLLSSSSFVLCCHCCCRCHSHLYVIVAPPSFYLPSSTAKSSTPPAYDQPKPSRPSHPVPSPADRAISCLSSSYIGQLIDCCVNPSSSIIAVHRSQSSLSVVIVIFTPTLLDQYPTQPNLLVYSVRSTVDTLRYIVSFSFPCLLHRRQGSWE